MAVPAEQLEILEPIVISVAVDVMQSQWQRLSAPLIQSTLFTSSLLQSLGQ
jgi:hypothetical protein